MFQQHDLFAEASAVQNTQSLAQIIERITACSKRPRYAFMVLNLIAEAAGPGNSAGPYVSEQPIRDWLSNALMPLARRGPRRRDIEGKIRTELKDKGLLPSDPAAADAMVEDEVRAHVRQSARCNISTAVSDLVRAGLLRRHYQGFRVDHVNRGAQREAVYILTPQTRLALRSVA